MYILECSDGSYYTGSTNDLEFRLSQHQAGEGANHTRKRLPVKLVYYEEFRRVDEAFYREKQVQGWGRKKKEALIENRSEDLPLLSKNYTQYPKVYMVPKCTVPERTVPELVEVTVPKVVSTSSTTGSSQPEPVVTELVEGTANKIKKK